MGRRFVLILGFALVIGLVTGSLVYRAITQKIQVEASVQPTEEIVVAAANLRLGEIVTSQHLRVMSWPKGAAPGGAVRSTAEAMGRMALSSFVVGEPLLNTKLSKEPGGKGLLSMLVPENFRGVTIKVDDAVRESGFVSPNSRVDVVVTILDRRGSGERTSKVILQNVLVLAAGQAVEMRGNKPVPVTTVTLALTPEQAENLALAKTEGKLMLATRNLGDGLIVQTRGSNVKRLLGKPSAPPRRRSRAVRVNRPQPEPYTVTVYNGNKMTTHEFNGK